MNDHHDPNLTADVAPTADSLDRGLAAAFGPPSSSAGASVLQELRRAYGNLRPVLLRDAEGDSSHVVRPHSDAMPDLHEAGARYQLVGEIARGGMGAVLRGRDVDLGRDVAVKVLLEKHAGNPEVMQRFVEEAQIGGQLQHPGIVPLYEFGRFGERPFFSMKLVKGRTLAALLSERNDLAQDRPLYLGIALQVCQTLAYAHAKGVIHRDLKPANVMVGAFGEVQVMDWGLAKVLTEGGVADEERTLNGGCRPPGVEATVIRTARSGPGGSFGSDTEAGSLMGTPAYMPPEQANGDVNLLDRRTDVFGLGAILCEILTGKPPYVGRSAEEVRRKAANGDQADMLARFEACGADAELLALAKSCLAPEPIDRPRDAQAVADALTAYRNGVQERLRRAEIGEAQAVVRVAEERKRRRVQLALAASVLLTVGLAGAGGLWAQQRRAEEAARQAAVEAGVAAALLDAERSQEQARFAEARAAVSRAEGLLAGGGSDALRERCAAARADLDMLARLDDIRLQAGAAVDVLESRFDPKQSAPKYAAAFRDYGIPISDQKPEEAARQIQGRAIRVQLVAALDDWARAVDEGDERTRLSALAQSADPDPDGAASKLRQALAKKDRAGLERLAKDDALTRLSPSQLKTLGHNLRTLGAEDEAIRLLRQAQQKYPSDFWINHSLAYALECGRKTVSGQGVAYYRAAVALRPDSPGVYLNFGNALHHTGDLDGAADAFRKAIELAPKYAAAHASLGGILHAQDDLDRAIEHCRHAIELNPNEGWFYFGLGSHLRAKKELDNALAAFRKGFELNPDDAVARSNFGLLLRERGDTTGAIESFRHAIQLDPAFAMPHINLGVTLKRAGDLVGAAEEFKKATEAEPNRARAHFNLGSALAEAKDLDGTIDAFRQGLELDPTNARGHTFLGRALVQKEDLAGAIESFRRAVRFDPENATAYFNLAHALGDNQETDEAITVYRQGIELNPKDAKAHNNLGLHYRTNQDPDAAMASFRKALELDPKLAQAHYNLGLCFRDKREPEAAIASFRRATELAPTYLNAHNSLGIALRGQRRLDEAAEAYQNAINADPNYAPAHYNLGLVLRDKQDLPGAIAEYRQAVAINPNYLPAQTALGLALTRNNDYAGAVPHLRKVAELDPNREKPHFDLGHALWRSGDLAGAIEAYRRALAINPQSGPALNELADVLIRQGDVDNAIATVNRAIEIAPTEGRHHFVLGIALGQKDDHAGAAAAFRKAIEFSPGTPAAHWDLGAALISTGRFAEAAEAFRGGLQTAADRRRGMDFRAEVQKAEKFVALDARRPALLSGAEPFADTGERMAFAEMLQCRREWGDALRVFTDAFTADPGLAHDANRYNAACCAARVAAGSTDDAARPGLRRQALDWLRAELTARAQRLDGGDDAGRTTVRDDMRHWQRDNDFASVRGDAALAKLPADEREAWAKLWGDVAALERLADKR